MSYIGIQPAEKFTSFATQTFSVSATTSYTLDHSVANENELALFVNNVRQQPGSGKAYTATGTALTLSAATATTDTMYCIFLGRALQTVVPATNSITAAMVGNDLISGKDALASEPADTDEFLVSDAGTLKRIDYSLIKGGGISVAHQWRVTTTFQGTASPVASNWEQADTDGYGGIGTAMSESSGIFTFPSTGVYLVQANVTVYYGGNLRYWRVNIQSTTDNSSYADAAGAYSNMNQVSSNWYSSAEAKFMFDVTNTSTHKVRMVVTPDDESAYFAGATDQNLLYFTFIRLGDT